MREKLLDKLFKQTGETNCFSQSLLQNMYVSYVFKHMQTSKLNFKLKSFLFFYYTGSVMKDSEKSRI